MFSSPTNRSPLPLPSHSGPCHPERSEGSSFCFSPLCALSVSAFSFPGVSSFNFRLTTVNSPSLSSFRAILADHLQLTENPATLSPAFATLTRRVKLNPFVCHSYKKHRGWGLHPSSQTFSLRNPTTRLSPLPTIAVPTPAPPALGPTWPHLFLSLRSSRITVYGTRATFPLSTNHSSLATISFRFRTYKKTGGGARRVYASSISTRDPFSTSRIAIDSRIGLDWTSP